MFRAPSGFGRVVELMERDLPPVPCANSRPLSTNATSSSGDADAAGEGTAVAVGVAAA